MVGGKDADGFEHLAQAVGHGGFSGAGVAGEDDVDVCDGSVADAAFNHALLHLHTLGDGLDLVLDRTHANHVVEGGEDVVDGFLGAGFDVGHGEDVFGAGLERAVLASGIHAHTHALYGGFEAVLDFAGIAETLAASEVYFVEVLADLLLHIVGKCDGGLHALGHVAEDLGEFGAGVVAEVDSSVKTTLQAGVCAQELLHFHGVSGHDAHEFAFEVFAVFEQSVDHLLAEGIVLAGAERVGFVDEEHAAHGIVDSLAHKF